MQFASGLSLASTAMRAFFRSDAHVVNGRPPSMLPPASKNVATGGPFGSYGNGGVAASSETPPRPGWNAAGPVLPSPRPAAGGAPAGGAPAGGAPAPGAPGAPARPAPPRPR